MKASLRKLGVILLILVFAVTGCGSGNSTKTDNKGTASDGKSILRIAGGSHLTAFDPQLETTSLSMDMHIYETLVVFSDENFSKIEPVLAERWENSTDGLEWTFYLKKGIKFSDGSPFNAEAVKFTLERMMDPATASPNRAKVEQIDKVTAVDENTVKITTKQPYAPLLENLATYHLSMLSPSATKKYSVKDYGMHPVGTGPYMLEKYDISGESILVRNPNYRGKPGNFERISYRAVPEAASRVMMLQNNEIDIATALIPEVVSQLKADKNIEVVIKPSTFMISLNHMIWKGKPYDNKLVRQAMMYAVDREAIVKSILLGNGAAADGPFSPGVQGYIKLGGYEYNPEKAKELLKQAGYPDGFSMVMWAPEGRYMKARQVSEAVQGYLAKVGIKAELKMSEWATYGTEMQSNIGDRGMQMLGSSIPTAHWRIQRIWGSQKMASATQLPSNSSMYSNPQVDALLAQAAKTFKLEDRVKLLQDAQKIIWDDAPYLWLYSQVQIIGVRKGLSGYFFYGNEDWRMVDAVYQK